MHHADEFGLSAKEIEFDLAKVVKRSRDVAKRLSAGVKHLLKKNKVAVFDGHGRLDVLGGDASWVAQRRCAAVFAVFSASRARRENRAVPHQRMPVAAHPSHQETSRRDRTIRRMSRL
jgi:hypothetical protein